MNQTFQTGSNAMNTGFNTGMTNANSALATWGNTLNQGYQNQLSASQQSSGIGGLLGQVAGVGLPMLFGMAEGGAVPTMGYQGAGPVAPYPGGNPATVPPPGGTPGGAVPTGASPTAGQASDDVPAALTAGEFVMPRDVTQWIGEQGLQKMIQKSRKEMQMAQAKPSPTQPPPGPPTFASRPGMPPQGAPAMAAASGGAIEQPGTPEGEAQYDFWSGEDRDAYNAARPPPPPAALRYPGDAQNNWERYAKERQRHSYASGGLVGAVPMGTA
jgi:hypothetical protein